MRERERRVLSLWERGAGLDRWERDAGLIAACGTSPDASLGANNAALLGLRNALFGGAWRLTSRCPVCATDVEFPVDSAALADTVRALVADTRTVVTEWDGATVELRAPTAADLRALAACEDAEAAARGLVGRCASCTLPIDDRAAAELGSRLEGADPAAVVSFSVCCAECGHQWSAPIDVGEAVWTEVRRAAEQTLVAIDALARVYGWTEHEVLCLSPTRRAAYLQLVGAS